MRPIFLPDHRCTCGKLLCKGTFIVGVLEIKCRFCRRIVLIDGYKYSTSSPSAPSFGVMVHLFSLRIVGASKSLATLTGYTTKELLSMRIIELSPFAKNVSENGGILEFIFTRIREVAVPVDVCIKDKKGVTIRVQATPKLVILSPLELYVYGEMDVH